MAASKKKTVNNRRRVTKRVSSLPEVAVDRDDWRARDDARTLAVAKEIAMDKQRHARALKEAKKMAEDKRREAEAMSSVAQSSPTPASLGGAIAKPGKLKSEKVY